MKSVTVTIMCFMVLFCSACTSTLSNRSVPPADGDPFIGVGVTVASGPVAVTSANNDLRRGIAESYSIFDLISFGDATSATACKNGNIDVIKAADVDILKVQIYWVPIFKKYTTVVTGK